MKSIVALCSSHINCFQRLMYLEYMLKSWFQQTLKIPIYLSVSCSKNTNIELNNILDIWKKKTNLFHFFVRPMKLSQFEHYNLLVYENKFDWILFTDDDDLWNNTRVETYVKHIKQQKDSNCILLSNVLSNWDLVSTCINDIKETTATKDYCVEYVNYSMKSEFLKRIINIIIDTKKITLNNPVFDMYLKSHIQTKEVYYKYKPDEFLYFHRLYSLDATTWKDDIPSE
jgi:hypothetical protein